MKDAPFRGSFRAYRRLFRQRPDTYAQAWLIAAVFAALWLVAIIILGIWVDFRPPWRFFAFEPVGMLVGMGLVQSRDVRRRRRRAARRVSAAQAVSRPAGQITQQRTTRAAGGPAR